MRQSLAGNRAELDTTTFPVVVVRELSDLSDAGRAELESVLDAIIDDEPRHALVLDLTEAKPLPEAQREFVAERTRARIPEISEKRAALAVVVKAPLLHQMPLAAYWLRVSPVPAKVFTNLDEAMVWARAHALRTRTGEMSASGIPPRSDFGREVPGREARPPRSDFGREVPGREARPPRSGLR